MMIMKYVSGKQISKHKYQITIEVTDYDLNLFDNLAHCICTLDKKYHRLEPQYERFIQKTEGVLWKYVDYYKDKKLSNSKKS